MQSTLKVFTLYLTAAIALAGYSTGASAQTSSSASAGNSSPRSSQATSTGEPHDEEAPDDELDTAAVKLDVSHASSLIQTLYLATRETKEQLILDRLNTAKQLIAAGANVNATDQYGRTALHWTVFGSSYSTKPKVIVSYEEVADQLIQHGVDINHQDIYHDTALDYLLYSPNYEIQTLLIEKGATSGFLIASFEYVRERLGQIPKDVSFRMSQTMQADLTPGQTLSIRLNGPVFSEHSRTGDPIEGTVTYPLCKNGEDITCPPGQLVVPPGTRVQGTVLFAQKAPNKYSLPRLVLDFANIVHEDGTLSPLYTRVIDVDNARESVRNNEILGIVQPHASTKASIALAAVSASNPIAGYTIKGFSAVYGLSIRREILFPAGTDLQVQIVRPSMLLSRDPWSGWPLLPVDAKLKALAATVPIRTSTKDNRPSDLTNLMFLGSRQQLVAAFREAGWFETDNLNPKTALKTVQATFRDSNYSTAPVSLLMLEGRSPDIVFQKSLDTFAKRHHIRIWKMPETYQGREIWVGAATHDIAISTERKATKWSHRIDPHIDREREWVETDLLFAGTAGSYALVDRPDVPKRTTNATGDDILTDGQISIVALEHTIPGTAGSALALQKRHEKSGSPQ